ncbi:cysteine hydrolase [Paraburkholderia sediminicola]|uniref:cysteine hydrolase family protein n=1 Tax=Paraburkholderia sediminicola TaxID=458836 RepID=UPI0038B71272
MHAIQITPEVLKRTIANRGGEWAFEIIDPSKTCHVIIDLQYGFMEKGAPLEVPMAREIVSNVNEISRTLRAAGGMIAYTRWTYRKDEPNVWSNWYHTGMEERSSKAIKDAFVPWSQNHALWQELDVAPEDVIVDKTRFSAFTPGTCDLKRLLEQRGIDTVIVSGTLTNSCCESTARDACQLNYKTIFVADATATFIDFEHNATLNSLSPAYADIMCTEKVCSVIALNQLALSIEQSLPST